jgi:hypothetical protein
VQYFIKSIRIISLTPLTWYEKKWSQRWNMETKPWQIPYPCTLCNKFILILQPNLISNVFHIRTMSLSWFWIHTTMYLIFQFSMGYGICHGFVSIYVKTFTSDVIVFIGNVMLCMTSYWSIIYMISISPSTLKRSLYKIKGEM